MKLRNKKTGEIGYLLVGKGSDYYIVTNDDWEDCGKYDSLAELNEEWEDYEEPKEHWCITMYGGITRIKDNKEPVDDLKEIGNYFKSKEDAYDALDELKAWKRLKDKGFRFIGIDGLSDRAYFEVDSKYLNGHVMYDEYSNTDDKLREYNKDLELLFGGEE